jgi:FKBP-type peptidyl-prolyl cis-trans isomerase
MKKSFPLALALALCLALALASPLAAESPVDVSYSLGMLLGANLKSSGLEVSPDAFLEGFKAAIGGTATKYTDAQAQAAVQTALQAASSKKSSDNIAAGKAFLTGNAKKAGISTTASGLQYQALTTGTGPKPKSTDTVKVNYEGKLLDGTVFDSSYARKEPATFPLDGVIAGWTEGVQLMPVGSKFRFFVPSELAYGEQGAGGAVGPNAVLIFEVELLSIETGK